MKTLKSVILGGVAGIVALLSAAVIAQQSYPLVTSVTGAEIVKNEASPTGAYMTTAQIATYAAGASGGVNAQTGTTYTVLSTDAGKLVTFSNGSPVAVTLSVATATGFTSGKVFWFENKGAGAVTITPTTSTINGASTLVLSQNRGAVIYSDGTNYQIMGGAAGLRVTPATVPEGGTGAATFTANGVLLGNTASAVAVTAAGTNGQLLQGATGSAPAWATTLSGTLTLSGNNTYSGTSAFSGVSTFSSQIRTTFGTPTIASGDCGATTNGVITSGTNQAGLVTIGAASTTTCTISFSATLGNAPGACVVFPHDAGGAATGTTVARVSSVSTTNFVITGSALASTSYYWICL